ncbi:MAG: hypothetical protein GKR91_19880 [Pseudomonadales bacterium]|nr:hypothetical protein [Pseudomonadales bacterium]
MKTPDIWQAEGVNVQTLTLYKEMNCIIGAYSGSVDFTSNKFLPTHMIQKMMEKLNKRAEYHHLLDKYEFYGSHYKGIWIRFFLPKLAPDLSTFSETLKLTDSDPSKCLEPEIVLACFLAFMELEFQVWESEGNYVPFSETAHPESIRSWMAAAHMISQKYYLEVARNITYTDLEKLLETRR